MKRKEDYNEEKKKQKKLMNENEARRHENGADAWGVGQMIYLFNCPGT